MVAPTAPGSLRAGRGRVAIRRAGRIPPGQLAPGSLRVDSLSLLPWANSGTLRQPGILRLPSGKLIRGRSLSRPLPDGLHPAFGVYLLGQPPPDVPWESRWLRWPDFRLPADRADVVPTLTEAWQRAATERVEIACTGWPRTHRYRPGLYGHPRWCARIQCGRVRARTLQPARRRDTQAAPATLPGGLGDYHAAATATRTEPGTAGSSPEPCGWRPAGCLPALQLWGWFAAIDDLQKYRGTCKTVHNGTASGSPTSIQ